MHPVVSSKNRIPLPSRKVWGLGTGSVVWLGILCAIFGVFAAGTGAWADDRHYTWNIANGEDSFPDWLREIPVPRGIEGGRRDFQVIPPKLGGNLAVTLFFDEPDEGELRVLWRTADLGQVLTPNLFEGTALPNQRTIILRENLLYRPGVLSLFCSEPELPVWRIQFQWLMPQMMLVPSADYDERPQVILPDGEILTTAQLPVSGQVPARDVWRGENLTAVLSADPQRLDDGIEFVFDLQKLPAISLLQLELTGAPLEGTVWVWLNGTAAVPLHLALPGLLDGGFRTPHALDGTPSYTGWRTGTAYIPPRLLQPGENTLHLQFLDPLGKEISPQTLARNVVLNIQYAPPAVGSQDAEEPSDDDDHPTLDPDSPELATNSDVTLDPPDFSGTFIQQYSRLTATTDPDVIRPTPSLVPIPGAEHLTLDLDPTGQTDLPLDPEQPLFLPDHQQEIPPEDSLRLFLPDLAPALHEFVQP